MRPIKLSKLLDQLMVTECILISRRIEHSGQLSPFEHRKVLLQDPQVIVSKSIKIGDFFSS